MRRAFLELDEDRDGLITAEDIARYFGDEDAVDIVDLRKLLWEKKRLYDNFMREAERAGHHTNSVAKKRNTLQTLDRSTKDQPGLTCSEFTFWVGESIH